MRRPTHGPPTPSRRPARAHPQYCALQYMAPSTPGQRAGLGAHRLGATAMRGGPMTERQFTTSAYIILGLLASRDWSAYQLAEQVGRGVDQLWPRADRQRYITPKRLVEAARTVTHRGIGQAQPNDLLDHPRRARDAHPLAQHSSRGRRCSSSREWSRCCSRSRGRSTTSGAHSRRCASNPSRRASCSRVTPPTSRRPAARSPSAQHLFAIANTFMIGHYDHIIEWVTWALEQSRLLARCGVPRVRQRRAGPRHAQRRIERAGRATPGRDGSS